jgi:hypothetical protein
MNLHGVPDKPVAIPLGENQAALKTFEPILRQLRRGLHHGLKFLFDEFSSSKKTTPLHQWGAGSFLNFKS